DMWCLARQEMKSDFSPFADAIAKCVDAEIRLAELLGYSDHIYDAPLQQMEPDLSEKKLTNVFDSFKKCMIPYIKELNLKLPSRQKSPQPPPLMDHAPVFEVMMGVYRNMGFDFTRGRVDYAMEGVNCLPHCLQISVDDVRVVMPSAQAGHQFSDVFIFMHEMGHALHDQGIHSTLDGLPLSRIRSVGFQESQSQLWENFVGRSLEFWQRYYPELGAVKDFPYNSADACYRAANTLQKFEGRFYRSNQISIDLDNIFLYEMERDLLACAVKPHEFMDSWNEKLQQFLGAEPFKNVPSFVNLVNPNWLFGGFGYLPLYTLGNIFAGQIWQFVNKDNDMKNQIKKGDYSGLVRWLKKYIYHHGYTYTLSELAIKSTGSDISSDYYCAFLKEKFSSL
ncbi:MAG: hypothetical protein EOP48_29485, partial [Sphingobacteriales bacterium]